MIDQANYFQLNSKYMVSRKKKNMQLIRVLARNLLPNGA